jgi:hypothetical protein
MFHTEHYNALTTVLQRADEANESSALIQGLQAVVPVLFIVRLHV